MYPDLSTRAPELRATVTHEIIFQKRKACPRNDLPIPRPHLPGSHDNAESNFLY